MKCQFILIFDFAADVVRKSAVRIRYVSCPLKNDNLTILTEPAKSCSGGCSSGNPANNTDLHLMMVSAVTAFSILVVVMSAGEVRVIGQCAVEKSGYCFQSVSCDSREESDSKLC